MRMLAEAVLVRGITSRRFKGIASILEWLDHGTMRGRWMGEVQPIQM